jgi:FkbM family methyltransferase
MLRQISKEWCPPGLIKLARTVKRKDHHPGETAIERELARIRLLPPGQPATTNILGTPFELIDGKSFAGLYDAYFQKKIYDFTTTCAKPFIIDCGANVGVGVRWWKARYPGAKILAFEADPEIFRVLKANCGELAGVTLENAAVWNREGQNTFLAKGGDGGHMAEFSNMATAAPTRTVSCVRLRRFLSEKCDLLKIDIEGAEVNVLRDCADSLEQVSRIFVEHHSFVGRHQHLGETLLILEKAGFRIHAHVEVPSPSPFHELLRYNEKDLRLALFCFRPEAAPGMKALD